MIDPCSRQASASRNIKLQVTVWIFYLEYNKQHVCDRHIFFNFQIWLKLNLHRKYGIDSVVQDYIVVRNFST